MIALVGGPRSVAVVQVRPDGEVLYRSINSSRTFIIGFAPLLGASEFLVAIVARKPAFRRPWIVVEYRSGAVWAARINRRMKLDAWKQVL